MANKWMPVILESACTGCGLCVEACGPRSLAMDIGLAVLAFPDTCGSEEHCVSACPEDAIQMRWLPFSGNRDVGRWNTEIAYIGDQLSWSLKHHGPPPPETDTVQSGSYEPEH